MRFPGTPIGQKRFGKLSAIVVMGGVPFTFIVTLALMPLWNWIEGTLGIESVGHSGPADWCFATVYIVSVVSGLALVWRTAKRNGWIGKPPE